MIIGRTSPRGLRFWRMTCASAVAGTLAVSAAVGFWTPSAAAATTPTEQAQIPEDATEVPVEELTSEVPIELVAPANPEVPQDVAAPQPDAALPAQPAPQVIEVDNAEQLYSAFYATPAQLPDAPGQLIRQEPSNFYLGPAKGVNMGKTSTRIMYSTTNFKGEIVHVTGTVLESKTRWRGQSPRPLITYAVGTQGVANQCAPSVQGESGTNYESVTINSLLNVGYNVVVTDYVGLGTEGPHTYMNRLDQGHAVLDAARAATQVGVESITTESPVAVVGYSQGGGGAGAAAELAPSYAPELPLVSAVVGAPPADLEQVADQVDSSIYSPFLAFALQGFTESYGLDRSALLNPEGEQLFETLASRCTLQAIFSGAPVSSSKLTNTGENFKQLVRQEPLASVLAEQKLGVQAAPQVPTLINHSVTDDVIPYKTGRDLASRWCAAGTQVTFNHSLMPTHIGGYVGSYTRMLIFLDRQFKGWSSINDCRQFR